MYLDNESSDFNTTISTYLLNIKYFGSVYSNLNSPNFKPASDFLKINSSISNLNISHTDIMSAINNLKDYGSACPDGIPTYIVKKCCSNLVKPIHMIFNLPIDKGIFPEERKRNYSCT